MSFASTESKHKLPSVAYLIREHIRGTQKKTMPRQHCCEVLHCGDNLLILTLVVAQALGANKRRLPPRLSRLENLVLQPRSGLDDALLALVCGEKGLPFLWKQTNGRTRGFTNPRLLTCTAVDQKRLGEVRSEGVLYRTS